MPESLPPVVCTLTTKALVERSVEWADIRAMARTTESLPDGARSTFALSDAEAIEDLASREMICCGSWLRISTARSEVLTMELTTDNPEGLGLIRSIAGLAG